MGKFIDGIIDIILMVLVTICANCVWVRDSYNVPVGLVMVLLLVANLLPFLSFRKLPDMRIRVSNHGARCLRIFAVSTMFSVIFNIVKAFEHIPDDWKHWLWAAFICFIVEAVIFWNGMICVYLTSVQMGIQIRVLGAVFGMVPVANLYFLGKIIKTVSKEVDFETDKYKLNLSRRDLQLCKTKYPILMVHGVFFRDSEKFNYWGRIPKDLINNGATIYYGEHQSAASVSDSAEELAERIKKLVEETGCGKLNIIAHSKGGLDCRYAIQNHGIGEYVASLTTVNSPHRGCKFADYVLEKMPEGVKNTVANTYNMALRKLGDENPDFLAAVYDLTSAKCSKRDEEMPVPENIYCQSIGSKLNKAANGKFPLNFSYHLVKYFDGDNDGLVGEDSFKWGDNYTYITTEGKRGISHADVIDLNRENIPGFDVREYYVNLVSDLKARGL